jgi:hypothetical protein
MPKFSTRNSPPPAPKAPLTTVEGAKRLSALAVQAFDRKDGSGVDWRLMTDSLFRAAFDQLDKLPEDIRLRMAERVHAAAYGRFMATEAGRESDSRGAAHQLDQAPAAAPAMTNQPRPTP